MARSHWPAWGKGAREREPREARGLDWWVMALFCIVKRTRWVGRGLEWVPENKEPRTPRFRHRGKCLFARCGGGSSGQGPALLEPSGHQGAGAWEEGAPPVQTEGGSQAVTHPWLWASPMLEVGWGAVMGELRRVIDSAVGRLVVTGELLCQQRQD